MTRRFSFPPIIDKKTKVVILGTMPGEKSLEKGQYYGHPQNQFWRLLGAVIGEELQSLPYDEKLRTLQKHGIGIWDVYHSCRREGSSDAAIREEKVNALENIKHLAPELRAILFNGKNAAKQMHHFKGIDMHVLPSSSPLYWRIRFDQKLEKWREAIKRYIQS